MKEKEYYNAMANMSKNIKFKTIHKKWFECFSYILKSFKLGYNNKIIKSLFYEFDMVNWVDLHKENSIYRGDTKKQLIEKFCGECGYISDRVSYDRLFRTHWLFSRAFEKELDVLFL